MVKTTDEAITKAALARELHVTKAAVTKWLRRGLPVRGDGQLNRGEALEWLRQNVSGHAGGWTVRKPGPDVSERATAAQAGLQTSAPEQERESLSEAQRRREIAAANLKEIEEAERRGALIRKDEAEAAWAECGIKIRDAVMGLPAAICNRLPSEWRREVARVLEDEVRRTLTALSREISSAPKGRKK